MKKINITENGVWAGVGDLNDGIIENCAAILGGNQNMANDAYDAIEQAIGGGGTTATIGNYVWEWEIIED